MPERIQPIPDRQPSTTRAVAWGAMFFALLSFCFSFATFFLTYKDGRLVRNLKDLSGTLAEQYRDARGKSSDATPTAAADPDAAKIGDRIGRVEAMIGEGDDRAKYYLDNLSSDLAQMRESASNTGHSWMDAALDKLNAARADLEENAPAAREKLHTLGAEIRDRATRAGSDLRERAGRLGEDARALGESLREKGAAARESIEGLQRTGETLNELGRRIAPAETPNPAESPEAEP